MKKSNPDKIVEETFTQSPRDIVEIPTEMATNIYSVLAQLPAGQVVDLLYHYKAILIQKLNLQK